MQLPCVADRHRREKQLDSYDKVETVYLKELFSLFALLVLSALFSGSETALVSISRARVESLLEEGRRGARALFTLTSDPSRMLITILIGNNLVNIAAASLATVVATDWFGHLGPGIAVGVLTVLILIFGEITPKSLATRYSERISLFIAPLMLGLMRLLHPLVWLFSHFTTWVHGLTGIEGDPSVTEMELIRMADHGEKEGTIERGERELIERVFALNDLTVGDVMTPRNQVFALEGERKVCDALPEILLQSYSRIPIFLGHPDEIRGVLFLWDILKAQAEGRNDVKLKDIAHETVFAPQNQPIDELFATLRRRNRHLAVVVDEFGTVRGIATMEDMLEELFGEIYDESDENTSEITPMPDGAVRVDGTAEVRVIENHFGIDLPGKPTDTISFWILSHAERIPRAGEEFISDGLRVIVNEASSRRIDQVTLERVETNGSDNETVEPG